MKRWLVIGLLIVIAAAGVCWKVFSRPPVVAEEPFAGLDENKQKVIWDAEHTTFKLETHFGKPFTTALAARDQPALARFFRDDFTGQVIDSSQTQTRRKGPLVETSVAEGSTLEAAVDAELLVARLVSPLDDIRQVERTRLRILKIERIESSPDQWRTHVLLTAFGPGKEHALVSVHSEHDVVFQFTDDIAAGSIIAAWRMLSQSTTASDQLLMEEVTASVGLDRARLPDNWHESNASNAIAYRFQTAVADYDRDGFLDIAVSVKRERMTLLRSRDGQAFDDVTADVGLPTMPLESAGNVYLATWIDFDNDGYPDLILGDRLYRNQQGQRFIDVTAQSLLSFTHSPKGCVVADYDCDGFLDLYVLYDHAVEEAGEEKQMSWIGDGQSGVNNELWHNEGGGRFRRVTAEANASGGARYTHAAAWMFFDDDRYPDLYVVNDFGNNVLLRNTGKRRFDDVTEATEAGDFATSMGVAAGDLDNDGSTEIYVANMYSKMGRRIIEYVGEDDYPAGAYRQIQGSCAGNRLYRLRPDSGKYEEHSEPLGINAVGWAYAPAMADFDGDGLLDLYATTGYLSFDRTKPDG